MKSAIFGKRGFSDEVATREQASSRDRSANGLQIVYSRTRVVDVDPKVLHDNCLVTTARDDATLNSYKMLRTQVLQRMAVKGWRSLAVTSARAGEGKSLTATNLAITLALDANHTVLLVDADMRRPSISRLFGCGHLPGLRDCLLDDIPVEEVLFSPGIPRLVILPGGTPVGGSSELLSLPKTADMIEELKNRYPERIVIFDLPPLLDTDDSLVLSPFVDAVLLVVEDGKTTRDDLQHAIHLLGNLPVIGTVLNKGTDSKQRSYG